MVGGQLHCDEKMLCKNTFLVVIEEQKERLLLYFTFGRSKVISVWNTLNVNCSLTRTYSHQVVIQVSPVTTES